MARETLEEMHARDDVECLACQRPNARETLTWTMSHDFARRFGIPEGKTRFHVYKLCTKCRKKAFRGDRWTHTFIEAAIVAQRYGDGVVYFDANGMPDIEGSLPH
jgi:hypothetical protein